MENDNTTAALRTAETLLAKAREFVAYVASLDKMSEFGRSYDSKMTEAQRLRTRADEIERMDAIIDRARELLPKIEVKTPGSTHEE